MTPSQPLGAPVPGWRPPPVPPRTAMKGRLAQVVPLDPARHAADLSAAFAGADRLWTWLPYGPFPDAAAHRVWIEGAAESADPQFCAVVEAASGRALGVASHLRIDPAAGSIEVGHICLAPALQGTPAATEAMALMMARAFDLGYRRYEWKCDALNAPSRRAAQRLGLSFEGVFRQATVVKGRNRDTAWYAAIDAEWPRLREAFAAWLSPDNFDAAGRQRTRLSDLTRPILIAQG